MDNLLIYLIIAYICLVLFCLFSFLIFFFYKRRKFKKRLNKVYKYKDKKITLVKNTLDKKIAMYFLLKQKFNDIIKQENERLNYEFVKPFDFTKIREQNVNTMDIFSGIILVCKKKELLPEIFECFINEKNINFDFERDYNRLSILASELVTDFFLENYWRIT